MAPLTLVLFGGFELRARHSQTVLQCATRKSEALVSYLAMQPRRLHRRDSLVELLWADVPHGQGRHSLRQTLSAVRHVVHPHSPDAIRAIGDAITLGRDCIDVDVHQFEALAAAGTPESRRQAVECYRGDFLHGFSVKESAFEDWAATERARLRELAVELLRQQLAQLVADNDTDAGIRTALQLLSFDRLQEDVHRTLMRLFRDRGQYGAALRQYETCARVMHDELGVEPEAETRTLHREMLIGQIRGRPPIQPPPGPASTEASPYPPQSTPDPAGGEPHAYEPTSLPTDPATRISENRPKPRHE